MNRVKRFWLWLSDPMPAPAWIETETFQSYGGTITRRVHWDHLFRVLAARGTPGRATSGRAAS